MLSHEGIIKYLSTINSSISHGCDSQLWWFKMHYAEFLEDDNSDNCRVLIFNVSCLLLKELTDNVPAGNCGGFLWYSNIQK